MTSEAAPATRHLVRRFGAVKWFGGHNSKTGRENNFGFVEDTSGKDVFLHRRQWHGESPPSEAQLITYLEEEADGKLNARHAESLDTANLGATELWATLCALPFDIGKSNIRDLAELLKKKLRQSLRHTKPEELRLLVEQSQQLTTPSIFSLVASGTNAAENYALLLAAGGLCFTDAAPWMALTPDVASEHESAISAELGTLESEAARNKCTAQLDVLSPSLLTYLLTQGVFTSTNQLGKASVRVYRYVNSVVIKGESAFPAYLKTSLDADLVKHGGRPSNPILRDILENLQFKKSLFERNTDFVKIYETSARLHRNIETFTLHHLFRLIVAGNDRDVAYEVFMQRLWEALTASKRLSLEQRKSQLNALFPSCMTMGPELACEAVYWPKQDKFLCRGRTCLSPQVMPDSGRHFTDFTIYDWFGHYGIDYMVSEKPQTKDFPIKLAAYFNRLREILPRLHCRACDDLMLPNMKYGRTQYKELIDGVVETKEMAAAYRLTVFHCVNDRCDELDVNHYISHCFGFGCYHIIDSRDLRHRCSEGRYVCKGCGSCCSDHAQSHPAGQCAECGSALEVLSEQVRGMKSTYSRKFVKCTSASCNFTIAADNLPAKFSLLPAKNNIDARNAYELD